MTKNAKASHLLIVLVLVVLGVVFLRTAWVGDDSYITYRVVDNIVNGYGPTWNTNERVQAYTHPLWMLLILPFYAITREPYFTGIFLSIVVSLLAMFLFAFKIARVPLAAVFGLAVFLFSKSFVDYSTSGLENPLTHLLLGLFLYVYLTAPRDAPSLFKLSLIAALALLTRMDVALLVVPTLVYRFAGIPKGKALKAVALGFLPFVAWELFSLYYYGFPFPNTAYAKLDTGIPRPELLQQGLYYVIDTLRHDPLTLIVVAIGLGLPVVTRNRGQLPIAIGIGLYVIYVVWIGGDFMSGRFFTPPLFAAVVLLSRSPWRRMTVWAPAMLAVVLIGVIARPLPLLSGRNHGMKAKGTYHGIADERWWYFQSTGLFRANGERGVDDHDRAVLGRELKAYGSGVGRMSGAVGMLGYYAGPEALILDVYGLCDPLLARLPVLELECRVGHCPRGTPRYVNSWMGREDGLRDERLAEYYAKLRYITRGSLRDLGRLGEIWKMNTGAYNYLIAPFFEARRYQDESERLYNNHKLDEAVTAAERAVELDPGRGAAWCLMSRALRRQGDLDNAHRAALNALSARGGKYESDLFDVGIAYGERGEIGKSIEVFRDLLEGDPENFDAHVALASAYEKVGRLDEAIVHYEKALAVKPQDPDIIRRLSALKHENESR